MPSKTLLLSPLFVNHLLLIFLRRFVFRILDSLRFNFPTSPLSISLHPVMGRSQERSQSRNDSLASECLAVECSAGVHAMWEMKK